VTALCEYACCPMRYRWQHQLRVNPHLLGNRPTTGAAGLDAATRGTLLHHCMEHLDFARPQPARRLVRRAVAELDLQESADEQALTGELAEMLDRFKAQPLWSELAEAKQLFRELDFVMAVPPGVLRGQIDLLYQDAEGQWHILDYKSDRVAEEHLAAHAKAYEIQMLSYALAAGKYLATAIPSAGPGSPGKPSFQATFPAEAKLYFLRIGRTYRFPLERSSIETTESELAKLLSWFLASETSGRFPPAKSDRCTRCPYKPLCP